MGEVPGRCYKPIRTALRLLPFVDEGSADDLTQSFLLKLYERDLLEKRPAIMANAPRSPALIGQEDLRKVAFFGR